MTEHVTIYFQAGEGNICIIVVSTYTDGQPPEAGRWFYTWLKDVAEDFRITKSTLDGLHFAVVGLGNSLYGDNFNAVSVFEGSMQVARIWD